MAAGDILTLLGTKITFSSGGDVTWTPANVANAAGRLSTRADLGSLASGRAAWFRWYAENQCQATPTVGNLIRYYLAFWNNETGPDDPDGDVGATDAAFATENDLRNLRHIGNVVVDAATADVVFAASGLIYIPCRYVSLVGWNASGAALTNDNAEHKFTLDPVYEKVLQS
jgi:hypothetical protein